MTETTKKQRAPKGSTPEQVNLAVPEGWKGRGGRLEKAAREAGDPSVNAFLRRLAEAEFKRLGV